ncbi:MAG TPA: hypothetical protein VMV40_06685 [Acidiferrobacter sp.]|nr:hypothetical protein [Acidiferrobacter sp.]
MEPFLVTLRDGAQAPAAGEDLAQDDALAQLSRVLSQLAAALEVEHVGPFVGVGAGRLAFCLAIRAHTEAPGVQIWGARVCSAEPRSGLRAHWDLARVARLRKPIVVQALPAFLAGYHQAVVAAGKGDTRPGRRVAELAHALCGTV